MSTIVPPDLSPPQPEERADLARDRAWIRTGLWALAIGFVLVIGAVLGGQMLGWGILNKTKVRSTADITQDGSTPAVQLGVHAQSQKLTGHTNMGAGGSGAAPTDLSEAAAQGEVVIDENGIAHAGNVSRDDAAPAYSTELERDVQRSLQDSRGDFGQFESDRQWRQQEREADMRRSQRLAQEDARRLDDDRGWQAAEGGWRGRRDRRDYRRDDDIFFGR